MNPAELFHPLYDGNPELLETVTIHSGCVARKALECLRGNGIAADLDFVREAAMLHDIGVVRCHAPSIHCFGDKPYICHGVEGSAILREAGFTRHALVCERHTGSGLSKEDIIAQGLPLPLHDLLPVSIEEKAICYADKFFSKSGNLTEEKSFERVVAEMERFGETSLGRFLEMHRMFAVEPSVKRY